MDVHVRRLRAKLGEEHAHLIDTVRSVGYRFGSVRWLPPVRPRRNAPVEPRQSATSARRLGYFFFFEAALRSSSSWVRSRQDAEVTAMA